MHATVSILCLIAVALAESSANVSFKESMKIIGGQPIDIKNRPFMLSFHNSYGFLCGASILSRKWAITALHCLISISSSNFHVRAGSNNPYNGGTVHRVTKYFIYNETEFSHWFSNVLHNDIVLFQVRPRFQFSKTVQPVRLPKENSEPPDWLYVCGWGYTTLEGNKQSSDVLMGTYVPYVPFDFCVQKAIEYAVLVKEDYHLCYGAHGKDSCYGDSGGPLANKNTIYGIVSFGLNCGMVPGVYSKISYYLRWIKTTANL